MLVDWIYWLSSQNIDDLLGILVAVLLLDAPRYALGEISMCLWDWIRHAGWKAWRSGSRTFDHCPSVCVVLAGYNEEETIAATLSSVWNTYPRMEIIIIDDGSSDRMFEISHRFAREHRGVLALRKEERGGKSSALNMALPYTRAEVIVTVDTDSHLSPSAIWEIVQPLKDPRVGAVSAPVRARNALANLVTWLQAYEYLHSTFLGRLFVARLGLLGIVSGAFGAFRRSVLEQVMGWDVGPGEDGDLTLRIRRAGYTIALAPYAHCCTNVPTRWGRLFRQRRRWEWAVVTFECRKHIDMVCFWRRGSNWRDFFLVIDRWLFNVFCVYGFWVYITWYALEARARMWEFLLTLYFFYLLLEFLQVLALLFYSNSFREDLVACLVAPLMPLYQLFLKAASTVAITEELLFRRSFDDNFVPERVREATWRW